MKRAALILLTTASVCFAADVNLVVDTDKVTHQVDPKVYGHFLEHIYHSCNGGLWGELIWDRSFEGGCASIFWSKGDNLIAQQGMSADVRLTFGSRDWTDYEFSVEARKTGGNEGFLVLMRSENNKKFYWANIGGWGNKGHALERGIGGDQRWDTVTRRRDGEIEENRWYRIRARSEGDKIQCWLDDELIIDYTDDGKGPAHGMAGVGTWNTQAQFRNFKVTSLDGKVLHEGLPAIPATGQAAVPSWRSAGSARVSTETDNPLNGKICKLIETKGEPAALVQQPMNIKAGETYCGSLWVRGEATGILRVQLKDGDKVLAEQSLSQPTAEWKEMPLELKASATTENASLAIRIPPSSKVWLDQISLMPDSWRKAGGSAQIFLKRLPDWNLRLSAGRAVAMLQVIAGRTV